MQRRGDAITIASTDTISAYLSQVRALQVGPASADPSEFAQQLISDAMQGNTSGIDELLRQAQDAQRRAKMLSPPLGAEAYHASLLDLLAETTRVLALQRQALVQKDPDKIGALMSSARALESRAKALQTAEQRLGSGSTH
jgi:hypothetical protein